MDLNLFVESIETNGAVQLDVYQIDGHTFRDYQGPSGKRVQILFHEDEMPDRVAVGYMQQLGLDHLVDFLFIFPEYEPAPQNAGPGPQLRQDVGT